MARELDHMAELTRRVDTPIVADESVFDASAAMLGVQKRIMPQILALIDALVFCTPLLLLDKQ